MNPIAHRIIHLGHLPPAMVQVAWVMGWLGIVGAVAAVVQRRRTAPTELTRKIVHIGTGNVILLAWWLQTPAWMGITASILFGGITLLSYRWPILPGINSVGRASGGTFFYAVSIGVLTAIFWPQQDYGFAALGILAMTWGDGLAALVGQAYGRHPYHLWGSDKSWEGSATMMAVTWGLSGIILANLYGWGIGPWLLALGIAIAATGLEAFSKLGLDNLTVPLGSAFLAYGLSHWWF